MLLLLGCVHRPPEPLRPTPPAPSVKRDPVDPVGLWSGVLPTAQGPVEVQVAITGREVGYSGSVAVQGRTVPAVVGVAGARITLEVAAIGLLLVGDVDGARWQAQWHQASQVTPIELQRPEK